MQRALQAQSSFDMRPRRADEFQKGRPTAPAIPRVKQMAQFFQSKQVKSMQRNSDRYLEICQSIIYYSGLLGRWDKRIIDQESDVPSIIFFILVIDLGLS